MTRFRVDSRCCTHGNALSSPGPACSVFSADDDPKYRGTSGRRFNLRRPWLLGTGVFLVTAGVFAGSLPAEAVQGPALVVPYQGYLEASGQPASGTTTLIFELYRTSEDTDELWTESHEVEIANGRFSELLGDKTSLERTRRGVGCS